MSDQCKHCTLRGDIEACRAAECSHHENWYAVQQQQEIERLKSEVEDLGYELLEANERGDS